MSAAANATAPEDLARRVRARVLERGIASAEEVARAEREAAERGTCLADALVAIGIATEDQMGHLEAEELGVPYVFPYAGSLDPELVGAFPGEVLRRHDAVPLLREPDHVLVALAGRPSGRALADLEAAGGAPVRFSLASRRRIRAVLSELLGPEPARGPEPPAARVADPAAVALLYGHLARAIAAGASEVRFDPAGDAILVRYRKGGRLEEAGREALASLPSLAARVKVLAGAPPEEIGPGAPAFFARVHRTSIAGRDLAIEVRVLPTRAGDSILLRLDPASPLALDLEGGGLSAAAAAALREVAALERGLVLVASWEARLARAVAAAIGGAADPSRRAVLSLEREAGAHDPRVRQVLLGGGPLDEALAAATGHRPDVLLVGEPPESEAQAAALLAASESALVVAVARDPDGPEAAITWLERGARPTLLGRALRALVSVAPSPSPAAGLEVEVLRVSTDLRAAIERAAPPFEVRAAASRGAS